jgi:superfamily II DNA or RNA helicase
VAVFLWEGVVDYAALIDRRLNQGTNQGFEPQELHDYLFDFQSYLVDWSVRKGRSAIFADCGMGKTAIELSWADNVSRVTGKRVLLLTPLAVTSQISAEAEKFGIDAAVSRDGKYSSRIVVTNYERLHHFEASGFAGVVCDESSVLKAFDSKTKKHVLEFGRKLPYRLACTATAAPNDYHELGNTSEVLGYLGFRDMLTTFFKENVERDFLGWGRTKYRFRGHAQVPFWQWVCSWARACRSPTDLGFDGSRFVLPELTENEHVIENSTPRAGQLFATPARGLREEREERRVTLHERCERVATLIPQNDPCVVWCHLNDEGTQLTRDIPDAVEVSGSMSDEEKEDKLTAFAAGGIRVLVTKPKIGCFGLNWQHCNRVVTFPSHSFEQYYQAVRRCWRFGQQRPVTVDVVCTAGEIGVVANLKEKQQRAINLFQQIVEMMNQARIIESDHGMHTQTEVPSWL